MERVHTNHCGTNHYAVCCIFIYVRDIPTLSSRCRCVRVFGSFKLWVEEPKIHEIDIYLPSLPANYNPDLLVAFRTRLDDENKVLKNKKK